MYPVTRLLFEGVAEDGRAPDRRAFAYPVKVVLFYDAQVEFVNLTTVLVHRYRG